MTPFSSDYLSLESAHRLTFCRESKLFRFATEIRGCTKQSGEKVHCITSTRRENGTLVFFSFFFFTSLKGRKAAGEHRGTFGRGRRQGKNDTYEQYESRAGLITQARCFLVRAIFRRFIFIAAIHLIVFIPGLE